MQSRLLFDVSPHFLHAGEAQSLCNLFAVARLCRRRAKKYCKGVMDQRTGPVNITQARCMSRMQVASQQHHAVLAKNDDDDDDLTMINVPQEAVGFVTGRRASQNPDPDTIELR